MTSSNQQITRCPTCGTAFRVTPTQLALAKGTVRCGSCLAVFNAADYWVSSPAQAPSVEKPAVSAPPLANVATQDAPVSTSINELKPSTPVIRPLDKSPMTDEDDILISDDMEDLTPESFDADVGELSDLDLELNLNSRSEVSLFERKAHEQAIQQNLREVDEAWAELLLEEEEGTREFSAQRDAVADIEAQEVSKVQDLSPSKPSPSELASSKLTPVIDPPMVFSLIEDSDLEPSQISLPDTSPRESQPVEPFEISDELSAIPSHSGIRHPAAAATTTTVANSPDPSLFEVPSEAEDSSPKRQVQTQPKLRATDSSRAALLKNIVPAPIEFNNKRKRHWRQRSLWPALTITALVALAAQLAWLKFDYFSRVEPYRSFYALVCPYLGCEVPALIDRRQITAFNLVVREHASTPNALAVDVMIMNNAPFNQPYPDLMLVFTDIDGKEVASRRFPPSEYLGGEAAGSELMEQQRPVHITLDLVDPGEQAVNYNIYIPTK